jgi:hypothetical protein
VLVIDPPPPLCSLLFSQLLKKRRAAEYSARRKGKGREGETAQVGEEGERRKEGKERRGEGRKGGSLCSNSNAGTSNKEEDGSRSVALDSAPLDPQ